MMNNVDFFFSGWNPLLRIVVVGTAMYIALVLILRITGSRTLATMNAFDLIVTFAIGSIFGRTLTAKDVSLAEGLTAFLLLIGLHFVVALIQTRWPSMMDVVIKPPILLYFRGRFLRDAMQRERVTEEMLHAAVRKRKFGSMANVEAVILESSGHFSVIGQIGDGSALGREVHKQIENKSVEG